MTTATSARTTLAAFAVTVVLGIGFLGVLWLWRTSGQQPTITSVDPFLVLDVSQVPASGLAIRIYGTHFQPGASVQFYTHKALGVQVVSTSEITATIPRDMLIAGWFDVLVRNPDQNTVIARSAVGIRNTTLAEVPNVFFTIKQQNDRTTYAATGDLHTAGSAQGYDMYPNIDVGLYRASPLSATDADKQFAADHYDFGGSIFDAAVKTLNPHFTILSYTILATLHNQGAPYFTTDPSTVSPGQADTSLTNFCTQRSPSCVEDDLLQHYQCDCDASAVNAYSGRCPHGIYTDATKTVKKPINDYCYQTFNCQNTVVNGSFVTIPLRGWNPANAGKKRGQDTFTPNPGCSASTAESPTEARAISTIGYLYPDYWYLPKYNTALFREYGQWLLDTTSLAWHGPAGSVGGVILDLSSLPNNWLQATGIEMTDQYFACFRDSSQCQCKAGQSCSMDYIQESVLNQANYDLWKTYQDVSTAVQGEKTGGQSRWGSVTFPGNIVYPPKLYPKDIYTDNSVAFERDHFIEMYYDGYQNGANTYLVTCADFKSMNDIMKNNNQNFYLNAYGIKDRTAEQSTPGSLSRGKIMSLAKYYLMQNTPGASGGVTHYSYDSDDTSDHSLSLADAAWNKAVEIDMGSPTTLPAGAVDIFGSSNTDGIYNYTAPAGGFICPLTGNDLTTYQNLGSVVYARQYTNGLVLMKERATWNNSDIWSDATRKTYSLDGYYRPVLADGTLGVAVNTVSLRNSEGAILVRNKAPVIGALTGQTVAENSTLSFAVPVSDPDGDTIGLTATGVPEGAHFTDLGGGRGQFTWTPTFEQAGTFAFTITAADFEKTSSQQVIVTVSDTDRAPVYVPITQQSGSEGVLIAFTVAATDPDSSPVTLSATNLPRGAEFTDHGDNTATFRWQPDFTQAGTYTVHVLATDGTLTTAADIAIVIRDAPTNGTDTTGAPRLSPIGHQTIGVGDLLAFTVMATASSGATVNLSVSNLPTGAKFTDYHDRTATFRWIPETGQEGVYNAIIFSANDGIQTVSESISITVLPGGSGGAYVDSKNFTAFPGTVKTGFFIASGNVWGDPRDEIIVGSGPGTVNSVRVYSNDGTYRAAFSPYPTSFRGGVRVAACDLDGDGNAEIITVPGAGYKPIVRIFDETGHQVLKKQFSALDGKFTGGLQVACGDINSDGLGEIVVSGSRGAASVMAYSAAGKRIVSFQPYGKSFKGGIIIAVLRGTSSMQIVVAPESGTKPVRRYSVQGRQVGAGVYPFGKSYGGGIGLSAGDVDGIGVGRILMTPFATTSPRIRIYSSDGAYVRQFVPYAIKGLTGVMTTVGDVNGDGVVDVVAIPSAKNSAMVRMFDGHGGSL